MIEGFYEYFTQKIVKPNYRYNRNDTYEKNSVKLLFLLNRKYKGLHSLGFNFLWDYFVFQYNYWFELDYSKREKIELNWIVGEKAFNRWADRDEDYDWSLPQLKVVEKFQLQKAYLRSKFTDKITRSDASKSIRARFHNSDEGFAICLVLTTLYDPKDSSCQLCKNRTYCKEVLKRNYPRIYTERGCK